MTRMRPVWLGLAVSGAASWIVTAVIDPHNPMLAPKAELAAAAVLALADWWRWRGLKIAEKAWAKVVDLGHRLTLVPIPDGAS